MVLSLHAKGRTTAEISAQFADVYGASVSKDTVSRIIDRGSRRCGLVHPPQVGNHALKAADVDDHVLLATQNPYQALIDGEAHAVIGAGPWERPEDRVAVRNGTRPMASRVSCSSPH